MLTVPNVHVQHFRVPERAPVACYLTGTWGDVIAGLGYVQRVAVRHGGQTVLYQHCVSPNGVLGGSDIARWLCEQTYVDRVVEETPSATRPPSDVRAFRKWVKSESLADEHRSPLLAKAFPCHVDFTLRKRRIPILPNVRTLPSASAPRVSGGYVLFQPRSTASCAWTDHWAWWEQAGRLLFSSDRVVLVGVEDGTGKWQDRLWPERPEYIDMVGKTRYMTDLFTLATRAKYVVTTTNGLAMYCAAKGIPCIACENVTHRIGMRHFFSEFLLKGGVHLVRHWEDLTAFNFNLRRVGQHD